MTSLTMLTSGNFSGSFSPAKASSGTMSLTGPSSSTSRATGLAAAPQPVMEALVVLVGQQALPQQGRLPVNER